MAGDRIYLPDVLPDRPFGARGAKVSAVSLGTAALGLDYGLPGQTDADRPDQKAAAGVIEAALGAGIRFFDTAPAYGTAESLLGEVTAGMGDVAIVTKVSAAKDQDGALLKGKAAEDAMMTSLEESARRLKRDRFAGVMLHSVFMDDVADGHQLDALASVKQAGITELTGASVYDEETALRVLEHTAGDILQVAYNLLDQRMADRVFPRALETGAGVVVRSAYLKGALTARGRDMVETFPDMARAVARVRDGLDVAWEDMAATALRFCLGQPAPVSSVLIGARDVAELAEALESAEKGPLPPDTLRLAAGVAETDSALLNPALWP